MQNISFLIIMCLVQVLILIKLAKRSKGQKHIVSGPLAL